EKELSAIGCWRISCWRRRAALGRDGAALNCSGNYALDCPAGKRDVFVGQCGVNQEHETGFAQQLSHRETLMRASRGEGFFKVYLAATSDEAGHSLRFDRLLDGVAIPSLPQHLGAEKCIVLVICVMNAVWRYWNSQAGQSGKSFGHRNRVTTSDLDPPRHFGESHTSECRLYLRH